MDKIEKIRAEIESRKNFFYERYLKKGIGCVEESRYDECVEILAFIDSLPDCTVCTKGNGRVKDEVFDTLSEEPDKSLEDAARRYQEGVIVDTTIYYCGACEDVYFANRIADAFIAGAKWQKEQMMKEAVEGEVTERTVSGSRPETFAITTKHFYSSTLKLGDKVKVIIIKDDGKSD